MLGCSGFRVLGFWRFEGFVFFEGFWGAQCGGVRASGSENVGFSGGLGVQGLGVWVVGTQRREATGRFFRIFGSGRLKVTGFRFLFWVRVNRIEGVQGSWDSGVLKQHFGLARSEVTRRWAILIHGGSGTFNFRLCKNPPLPPRDSCPPPRKGQEKQPGSSASRRRPFTTPCALAAPKARGPGLPFLGLMLGAMQREANKIKEPLRGEHEPARQLLVPRSRRGPGASEAFFEKNRKPHSAQKPPRAALRPRKPEIQAQTDPALFYRPPHLPPLLAARTTSGLCAPSTLHRNGAIPLRCHLAETASNGASGNKWFGVLGQT